MVNILDFVVLVLSTAKDDSLLLVSNPAVCYPMACFLNMHAPRLCSPPSAPDKLDSKLVLPSTLNFDDDVIRAPASAIYRKLVVLNYEHNGVARGGRLQVFDTRTKPSSGTVVVDEVEYYILLV